jgi:hypothetical protein
MSKSKSIRRAAFHHSEAVTQFLERPWLFGNWPVSKMFHSDTVMLLRFLSEDVSGKRHDSRGTAYEPSHQIRDHFQTILEVHLLCFDEELPLACVSLSITWVGLPAQPSEQLGCWAVTAFGFLFGHSYSGGGTSE